MPESQREQQHIEIPPVERSTESPQPATTTGKPMPNEIGGRGGLDPVRYGDWEKGGRCIDF